MVCILGSGEVEKDRFSWLGDGEGQAARLLGARAIACLQFDVVERQRSFGDLQPRPPDPP